MKNKIIMGAVMVMYLVSCVNNTPHSTSSNSVDSTDQVSTSSTSSTDDSSSSSSSTKVEVEYPNIEDGYVVYINLDGFARYYYDAAINSRPSYAPTLAQLANEGVVFKNLMNFTPSITNPMQAMIISGASSSQTKNVYRYYDRRNNIVVQQERENAAETIYQAAVSNNIQTATVAHFPALVTLDNSDIDKFYINATPGGDGGHVARFDQAIRLAKGLPINNGNGTYTVTEFPRLLTIYCDDLDAVGHNEASYYGVSVADSEQDRLKNVLNTLKSIDSKLSEFITALKSRGIYDKITFFLTTDHGMTPFGTSQRYFATDVKYAKTKWPALRDKLKAIDSTYRFEYVAANNKPQDATTVVGVSGGLQMQLSFKTAKTEAQLQEIANELMKEEYIETVLTRQQLLNEGYWSGAGVDLLVVPSERYHFHGINSVNGIYSVRGQHDSYQLSSRNVYGIVWGKYIKKLNEIDTQYSAPSFGSTMAKILNVTLKDANQPILHDIIDYSLVNN